MAVGVGNYGEGDGCVADFVYIGDPVGMGG
jgi:hypothetical protein